jgi:Fungal specific transcription factor domain
MTRTKNQKPSLDYVLPPRKKADELLETYWRLVDPLYPFLDKAETISAYNSIWIGEGPGYDEPTFLCLLNAIFCLACSLGETIKPEERSASATVFFLRARELFDFDIIRHPSVLTVQCLLVLGQYLQSTNEPQECWIFVGLAVRAAQSLSLHQPSRTDHVQDSEKRDLLRRIWHGCVLMDRALAMTFGRPTMISSQGAVTVPPPRAHQDPSTCYCSGVSLSREAVPTDHHFFLESIKLYEILNDILLALYSGPSEQDQEMDPYEIYFSHTKGTHPAAIFDLDRKLLRWSRDLPIHLRTDQDAGKHPCHVRQANVLWLRFRHIRMLLFRPVLSLFCTRHGNSTDTLGDTMPERIARQCSVMCVELAQEIIAFFQSRLENTPSQFQSFDSLLPAWWYNVLYVYTAATVLVAARISPPLATEISAEAVTASWEGAIGVLKCFEAFSKNTGNAATALEILYDKVTLQYRETQNQAVQQLNATARSFSDGQSNMPNPDLSLLSKQQSRVVDSGFTNSRTAIPVAGNPANEPQPTTTGDNFFDLDNFSLDTNDMSWLTSVPFQLYNDWDAVNGTF